MTEPHENSFSSTEGAEGANPGQVSWYAPRPQELLSEVPTLQLLHELAVRLLNGTLEDVDEQLQVGKILHDALGRAIDVHNNRYSRRRLADYHMCFLRPHRPQARPPVAGATWMELGCGAQNPVAFLFHVLALGAAKGIAVDLDPVQDVPSAMRALADVVTWLLIDPHAVMHTDDLSPEDLIRNLAGFDLARLHAGSTAGVDARRLVHLRESVYALPVPDASVDVVVSDAFFEHVSDLERAVVEIARVTRPGGWSIHVVDGSDHRHYSGLVKHPLAFLSIESQEPLVYESNRVRPFSFQALFARHGFEVVDFESYETAAVDEDLRQTFVEPFRSMPTTELATTIGAVIVRRR